VDQGDPLAGAVVAQLGHVQGALLQQAQVVLAVPPAVLPLGDELVEVLEALVVAGVHGHAVALGQGRGPALVLQPAEAGVLAWGEVGVVGVGLDHPAEAEGLVRLLGQVEAVVVALPLALGGAGGEEVALVPGLDLGVRDGIEIGEVLVEVLLWR